jgi:hypothetical protein
MRVREYRPEDLQALRRIHAEQNFPYELPDLGHPLFVSKLVLTDGHKLPEGNGSVLGAALLRLTAEAYLLLDPKNGAPRERWNRLLRLHAAAERDAWQRGLEDVHAWLPPAIAKPFGKRIAKLGWVRDDAWTPYCKRLSIASPESPQK